MQGSIDYTSFRVTTPTGKRISFPVYFSQANRRNCHCEYGHFNCAAWDDGPCSDEMHTNYDD